MENEDNDLTEALLSPDDPSGDDDDDGGEASDDSPQVVQWRKKLNLRKCVHMSVLVVLSVALLAMVAWSSVYSRRHNSNNTPPPLDDDLIPTLDDTLTMAALSQLVYAFHWSTESSETICDRINQRNLTKQDVLNLRTHENVLEHEEEDEVYAEPYIPGDAQCHLYRHDTWSGTQVLVMSSEVDNYVAVVYCGTDDLTTSLTDVNVLSTTFGVAGNGTQVLPRVDGTIRVHAGFDHSVFDRGLYTEVEHHLDAVLAKHPQRRIFTTGHSLGAANAILTAVGLRQTKEKITSINFGCPRTGNMPWRDLVNSKQSGLSIWRFVLGRDLVPRLPTLFQHVGHTVQLDIASTATQNENITKDVLAYYHHWGNATLGYAGVPTGWSATPYIWVPGALMSHRMTRYRKFLSETTDWIDDFERKTTPSPLEDDDFYDEPPDDDF